MFDVLMYLFETYIHNEAEMRVDQDKLTRDLTDAGFDREDIYPMRRKTPSFRAGI